MSESYEHLKTLTEGEFRIWLAGRLDAGDTRLVSLARKDAEQETQLGCIEERCAARRWHTPALKWLLGIVATIGSGAVGYLAVLAARHIFGGG